MSRLLPVLAVLCLPVVLGSPVSLPLYLSPINEFVEFDAGLPRAARAHAAHPKQLKAVPNSRLPAGSRSADYSGLYYNIQNVKLGNPPQTFNLTLRSDTHWSYVFDKTLSQDSCPPGPGQRNYFNSARSTTIRRGQPDNIIVDSVINNNSSCIDPNYSGFADGVHVTDDFRLGSLSTLKKIPFVVIKKIYGTLDRNWAGDGILGLMRNDDAFQKGLSTIHALAKSYGSPEISLFYKRNAKIGEQAGALTLGGQDAKNCDSTWSIFPLEGGLINWQVEATSYTIGSKKFGRAFIEFENDYSGIQVTADAYLEIVLATNAKYDGVYGYVVDCAGIAKFPSIDLSLLSNNGNFPFSITPNDYVSKLDNGKCFLNIDWDPEGWTVGTAVKGYCWTLHYGKEYFGLAKARQ